MPKLNLKVVAIYGLVIACLAVAALEFVLHRHAILEIESLPLFYALYGFIAFLCVVGGGVVLRHWLMRAPDYYTDKNDG